MWDGRTALPATSSASLVEWQGVVPAQFGPAYSVRIVRNLLKA